MRIKSPFNNKEPKIHPDSFLAPNCVVIGDVEISKGVNSWFSVVIRADWGKIIIGENTCLLDNCTIYAEPYSTVKIGENCIIGHNSCVYGPTRIGNYVKIGPNSTILSNTTIQSNTIIKPGTVVREGTLCRSRSIYGTDNEPKILKLYRSDLEVISQIAMKIAFYMENFSKFKEYFQESS